LSFLFPFALLLAFSFCSILAFLNNTV
jgi:hypothetical protein